MAGLMERKSLTYEDWVTSLPADSRAATEAALWLRGLIPAKHAHAVGGRHLALWWASMQKNLADPVLLKRITVSYRERSKVALGRLTSAYHSAEGPGGWSPQYYWDSTQKFLRKFCRRPLPSHCSGSTTTSSPAGEQGRAPEDELRKKDQDC